MTRAWSSGDPALDRGLHLGDGLFETILVLGGDPVWFDAHLSRLRRSASALGVGIPGDLDATVRHVAGRLWAEEGRPERAALRVVLSRGAWTGLEPDDGPPGLHVAVRALGAAPASPARLVVASHPRIEGSSPLAGHKTLSWMPHVEARRSARAAGADAALLLTSDGFVAEADAANLFAVISGRVVTPPLDTGVLPGITRAAVLGFLGAADERRFTPGELAGASEVFLTSSLGGVRAVAGIGSDRFAAPGPVAVRVAGQLAAEFRRGDCVGSAGADAVRDDADRGKPRGVA